MTQPDRAPVLSEDDDNVAVRPPVVDNKAEERLNPPTEYETLDLAGLAPGALKDRLNALGQEGWVLVATTPTFIFRRMKKVDTEKPKARVGFGLT
jgi:hypothetical protein